MLKPVNRTKEWKHWVRDMMMQNAQLYMFVQFTYKEMHAALALADLQVEDRRTGGACEDDGSTAQQKLVMQEVRRMFWEIL